MSYICPVCDADTHPMEEEAQKGPCIHEEIAIAGILAVATTGLLFAAGVI